jgi:TPP-dependent pyruvate/acetoin dehydrogenase alpha subunit
MNPADMLAFEEEIAQEFAAIKIRAPIHLGGGNEAQLIEIFKDIAPTDWVLAGWRAHYHCLLKGVPRDKLKASILAGRSVSLCFPEHKILCSGIVGGIAPIAVGLAWALKRRGELTLVNCFLGDMSAESGIVHEAMKYAAGHNLMVRWIVEDNGLSVCTNTQISWGLSRDVPRTKRYVYNLSRPHAGIGRWVKF